jgi:flavin reductase (DIM6/NTAB) family NADH-FMN oxidoreductase RutF
MTTILGNEVASALGQFASGICLVTAHHQEKDYALVAASICTASLEPPHIVVSVGNSRPILPVLQDSVEWVVNVLPESCVELVRRLTAGEFEHRTQAFESTAVTRDSATGARLVTDALAYWRCRTRAALPVGGQQVILAEVTAANYIRTGRPLVRWHRDFHQVRQYQPGTTDRQPAENPPAPDLGSAD